MTYRARGRSIFEVVIAVMFTGFLVGFITVLCIGNYFRAKRAQERQRQRRLAKAAAGAGGGVGNGAASGNAGHHGHHPHHTHGGMKNGTGVSGSAGGGSSASSMGGSPRSTFTPESAGNTTDGSAPSGYEAPQLGVGIHA